MLIWIIALVVIYTGLRPYHPKGDGFAEMWRTDYTVKYGWDITAEDHNNTSIVLCLFVPFIAKTFDLYNPNVFRDILPFFYAVTPVLLYFLFRRIISPSRAFLAAMFFIMLPPSYQQIPNVGKSMIAQPFAVASLLFVYSDLNRWARIGGGVFCTMMALACHYTVGIILLAWHIFAFAFTRKWGIVAVILVAVLFAGLYYSYAGGGSVLRSIYRWNQIGANPQDAVKKVLKAEDYETYTMYLIKNPEKKGTTSDVSEDVSMAPSVNPLPFIHTLGLKQPLHLPFKTHPYLITAIIYLSILVLFAGGIYWLVHYRDYLLKHKAIGAMMGFATISVILAMYVPFITKGLYLERWVQLAAIPMCGLYGTATYWLPRRYSYPIVIVILLAMLVIVR